LKRKIEPLELKNIKLWKGVIGDQLAANGPAQVTIKNLGYKTKCLDETGEKTITFAYPINASLKRT
jgi:hypothetical protein